MDNNNISVKENRDELRTIKAALDRFKTISFSKDKNDFIYHPHYLLRALKELHIDFEKE